MSISVTQRPSTTISGETSRWNAVNNPIVYKLATTDYAQDNYRLEIYLFNAANVALNTDSFDYTPDSTGNLVVNISEILRANLSPDFAGALTGATEIFDDTNVYLKFYIKYKQVWDASAESLVSDSANQFFAVLGSMQIPAAYGGNMAQYVTFEDG